MTEALTIKPMEMGRDEGWGDILAIYARSRVAAA
jgi:hypothetical protein